MADLSDQIESDGVTVWVNGPMGECLGRFGRNGIDIHTTFEAQRNGSPQCLHCTHGPVTLEHWRVFLDKMEEHYGVDRDKLAEHMPDRFLGLHHDA